MIRREQYGFAIGVSQVGRKRRSNVEFLHRLLPPTDQVATEALIAKSVHRHHALAPQPAAPAPDTNVLLDRLSPLCQRQ